MMQSSVEYEDGMLTLKCCGELDHNAAAPVMLAAENAAEEYMPRRFVMDFSGLSFMDSSGIAVLLKIERIMRQMGGGVEVAGANEQTVRVLRLSGLGGMLREQNNTSEECEVT